MFGIGWLELAVILGMALLLFGPKKLPEIGKGLGLGIKEFKKAGQELTNSLEDHSSSNQNQTDKEEKKQD
jgi:TatA/E family protein of Tat protein translocase